MSPEDLLAAWSAIGRISDDVYFEGEPVPDQDFDAFESETGLVVPRDLRTVLGLARDGLELTDVGLALHSSPPQTPAEYGLPDLPADMPPQLRVIGSDLGDDVWAVWLPRSGAAAEATPVVVIRDHIDNLALFDTVLPFLAVTTAAGLLDPLFDMDADMTEALDALGVPEHFRRRKMPERKLLLDALAEWATDGRERQHWWRKESTELWALRDALP